MLQASNINETIYIIIIITIIGTIIVINSWRWFARAVGVRVWRARRILINRVRWESMIESMRRGMRDSRRQERENRGKNRWGNRGRGRVLAYIGDFVDLRRRKRMRAREWKRNNKSVDEVIRRVNDECKWESTNERGREKERRIESEKMREWGSARGRGSNVNKRVSFFGREE